jgi:flagellar biosynthesis chaperone FliJ
MSHYRLELLLKLRARVNERAERAFAKATKHLATATEKLIELEADLARRREVRRRTLRSFAQAAVAKRAVAERFHRVNRLAQRLNEEAAVVARDAGLQNESVMRAQDHVEVTRKEWAEAEKGLETIARHKEKWAARRCAVRLGREERALEEVATAQYVLRAHQ